MPTNPEDDICGVYRYSPAGRAAPEGPWINDRCQAKRGENGLCAAHEKAIFGGWIEREIRAAQKQRESGKRRGGPTSKRPWEDAR